jgi:hypothetical protein
MGKMLTGKIKVGKTEYKYTNHPACPVCMAQDDDKPIRSEIDKYLVSHTAKETAQMVQDEYNLFIPEATFKTHIKNHSSYINDAKAMITQAAEKHALSKIDQLEEFVDADELIQDIITIGGHKIQTGEMDVDSKLLVAALKEQGARKKTGTLRDLLADLDKQRFLPVIEGELIEKDPS